MSAKSRAGVRATVVAAVLMVAALVSGCSPWWFGGGTGGHGTGVVKPAELPDCAPGSTTATLGASSPLVTVSALSPWVGSWAHAPGLVAYADGAAITSATPRADYQYGKIDCAVLADLVGRLNALAGADFGQPQVSDAPMVRVVVAAHGSQPGYVLSVEALGFDDDKAGYSLDADQVAARKELSYVLRELPSTVAGQTTLPIDRVEITFDPPVGAITSVPLGMIDELLPWPLDSVPAELANGGGSRCTVITGDDAAAFADTWPDDADAGSYYAVFDVAGTKTNTAVNVLLPGFDGCHT